MYTRGSQPWGRKRYQTSDLLGVCVFVGGRNGYQGGQIGYPVCVESFFRSDNPRIMDGNDGLTNGGDERGSKLLM